MESNLHNSVMGRVQLLTTVEPALAQKLDDHRFSQTSRPSRSSVIRAALVKYLREEESK